ncbi:MAG: hypothetical protein U0235_34290 [Polyangiaceae bacterium]
MRTSFLGVIGLLLVAACSGGGGTYISGPGAGSSGGAGSSDKDPNSTLPGDEGSSVPKSVTAKLAGDLAITEVALFQGLKATIAKSGNAATPSIPLVAARDALVRVYVKPASGYKARSLKAVLSLLDGDGKPLKAISDTKKLSSASTDGNAESTFNFTVPGQYLPLGVQYSVAVTDENADPVADGTDSSARFPTDGTSADLGVKSAGPSLKIVIVPVKYTADGSGRLPDTSAAQLQIDRDVAFARYPVPNVEVTVRQPFTWGSTVKGSGQGWSELLQALADLRERDGVDDDVYYWGAFNAAPSEAQFCGGGCVAGLSTVVSDPRDAYFRASIGVGFHGESAAETMAHEVGHAHGRNHAPCSDFGSIDGVDPAFPSSGHPDATLGTWAYDLVNQSFIAPTDAHDMMSYCSPTFVSDYTYKGLFDRLSTVNKGKALPAAPAAGSSSSNREAFQFVTIGADGPESFGKIVTPRRAPIGEPREVQLLDAKGAVKATVRGSYFAFDHLPGGFVMIPQTTPYAAIRVSGYSRVLTK